MDLTKLTYTKEKYPLKNMGDLVSFEGTDLLSHYYDPHTFDTYIRKWIEEDDKYTYYVLFRVGFVGFISFFKKTRSLRGWFNLCKDYTVIRVDGTKFKDNVEMSEVFKDNHEERDAFCDEYGPHKDSFYDEDIYSDYAKQFAKKVVEQQ